MVVDFHSHTFASDGTLSPHELISAMRERGVEIFSITDHDTLGAYAALDGALDGRHIVTGIEINTTYKENEVHILGYRLPLGPSPFAQLLAMNRSARTLRARQMAEKLQTAGYPVSFDTIAAEAGGGAVLGRPHVAKALVRAGIAPSIEAAFRDYLRSGRVAYVPSHHVTPAVAINAIKAAGGVAVLAHPGRLKDQAMIDEVAALGINGIEVFYPRHDRAQVAAYRAKAAHYGLVMTGGSDFHDIRWNTGGVGMDVDPDDLKPFLDLVA